MFFHVIKIPNKLGIQFIKEGRLLYTYIYVLCVYVLCRIYRLVTRTMQFVRNRARVWKKYRPIGWSPFPVHKTSKYPQDSIFHAIGRERWLICVISYRISALTFILTDNTSRRDVWSHKQSLYTINTNATFTPSFYPPSVQAPFLPVRGNPLPFDE